MSLENIIEPHLQEGAVIDRHANHNGQSLLALTDSTALVFRPLTFGGLESESHELQVRIRSTRLCQESLPENIPQTQMVILQGYRRTATKTESIKLFGRIMERYFDITELTEMSDKRIISSPEILQGIVRISLGQLKMMATEGVFIGGKFGKKVPSDLPAPLSDLMNLLIASNIYHGRDKNGKEKVFIDPDWYSPFPEGRKGIEKFLRVSSRLLARVVFFESVLVANKMTKKIGNVFSRPATGTPILKTLENRF